MNQPSSSSSYSQAMKIYSSDFVSNTKKSNKKEKQKKKLNISIQQLREADGSKQNNDLDFFYEIQRREHVAADRIQSVWKRSRRLIPWRAAVKKMLAIVKIQKIARGYLARKFVARWFYLRNTIIVELQARIRKYLSNLHVRPVLAIEQKMAVQIQRIVRGKLGRRKAQRRLELMAAIRIQCLWRGCRDRAIADKKWLNQKVVMIQNAMRKKLAMNRFDFLFSRYRSSVTKIQRQFRTHLAAGRVGKLLYEREMKHRFDTIRLLSNEEEVCQEKILRLMNRVVKQQIRENTDAAMQAILKQETEIYVKENDLIELRRQREILSPRAIERGFYEELTKNIEDTHEELAKLKFHHLFELTPKLHQHERVFENQVAELEELAANRHRVGKWRIDEYDERRHINYQRDINERRKVKKRAIAEEKRKWQVLFYTKDGKPDKKRRPGRPWDKSVYAGAEKATYNSVTGVDLLAFLRPPDDPTKAKTTTGIVEGVKNTVDQYSLQTFLDQVQVYEQLLYPISSILQKNLQLLPGQQQSMQSSGIAGGDDTAAKKADFTAAAEKTGFGPVGKEVAEALRNIGVRPPPETNFLKKKKGLISKEEKLRRKKAKEEEELMLLGDYQSLPTPSPTKSIIQKEGFIPITLDPGSSFSAQHTARSEASKDNNQSLVTLDRPPNIAIAEGEVITAEALRQRLRRYWKKPYQPHFPTEESFAEVDYGNYDHNYYYPMNEEDDASMRRRKRKLKKLKKKQAAADLSRSAPVLPLATTSLDANHRHRPPLKLAPIADDMKATSKFATKFSELISHASMDSSIASADASFASPSAASSLFNPAEHEKQKLENLRQRREQREQRREKKRDLQVALTNNRGSVIPWDLLDEIDGAKTKFENEKAYVEFYKKF